MIIDPKMNMKTYEKLPERVQAFQWFEELGEVGGVVREYSKLGDVESDWSVQFVDSAGVRRLEPIHSGSWVIVNGFGGSYPQRAPTYAPFAMLFAVVGESAARPTDPKL